MTGSGLIIQLVQDFSKRQGTRSFEESLRTLREIGLFQPALRQHGMSDLCAVLTELSSVDCGLAVALFSHWAAVEVLTCAAPDLYQVAPDSVLAFPAFQSPAEFKGFSVAERDGKILLSGKLESVVLAGQPTHAVIGSYYLPLTGGAVKLSAPVRTLGVRNCPHVDILMDQAAAVRLGGADLFDQMSHRMALAAGALALGIARASLDEALRYSKIRKQGGKEIFQWSEVKMLLGNMLVRLKTGAAALTQACAAADAGTAGWQCDAAAVAISLQELACTLTSDGIQVLGGAGYTTEFKQEQRFRDAFHTQHLLGLLPARKLRLAEQWIASNADGV